MEFKLEIGKDARMKSCREPNDVSFDGEAWRTEESYNTNEISRAKTEF